MSYFPFFMDVQNKVFLVVGGGRIAYRKIEVLLQFDTRIIVTAPTICKEIYVLKNRILLNEREFLKNDIMNVDFVIAATDNQALNTSIFELCKEKNKPVNVVDVKEECSFVFPAIIKNEDLVIAVSTGGNSPAMAAKIKKEINTVIPEYYGELIECLGLHREYIKNEILLPEKRMKAYEEIIGIAKAQESNVTSDIIQEIVNKYR